MEMKLHWIAEVYIVLHVMQVKIALKELIAPVVTVVHLLSCACPPAVSTISKMEMKHLLIVVVFYVTLVKQEKNATKIETV